MKQVSDFLNNADSAVLWWSYSALPFYVRMYNRAASLLWTGCVHRAIEKGEMQYLLISSILEGIYIVTQKRLCNKWNMRGWEGCSNPCTFFCTAGQSLCEVGVNVGSSVAESYRICQTMTPPPQSLHLKGVCYSTSDKQFWRSILVPYRTLRLVKEDASSTRLFPIHTALQFKSCFTDTRRKSNNFCDLHLHEKSHNWRLSILKESAQSSRHVWHYSKEHWSWRHSVSHLCMCVCRKHKKDPHH